MLSYCLELAIRSLRRNVVLTTLIVAAVGAGVGTSMTVLTTLMAMSGNPIPGKSRQLFVPQIDNWGVTLHESTSDPEFVPMQLSYRDAVAFTRAHLGTRQAAMYSLGLNVNPAAATPFPAIGRATSGDFFAMFEVPFRSGTFWGQAEDNKREKVVVLSSKLADRAFPRVDPVGHTISLGGRDYRVMGVIRPWTPTPRFYDLSAAFGETEDFYIPFTTAIDEQIESNGPFICAGDTSEPAQGWAARVSSECVWLQFWVELPTSTYVRHFRSFLQAYAADQQRSGRFHWPPWVQLHDVTDWIGYKNNHVVPQAIRINALMAVGFLVVCLVNAIALMLAKFATRRVELAIRRAMGASRTDLFLQCITESLIVGLIGGVLGLGLTVAGLSGLRALHGVQGSQSAMGHLYSENIEAIVVTLVVAVIATGCSALYPSLRASRVQPGLQIKAQ
jgi:putative ABC transport system permease protein